MDMHLIKIGIKCIQDVSYTLPVVPLTLHAPKCCEVLSSVIHSKEVKSLKKISWLFNIAVALMPHILVQEWIASEHNIHRPLVWLQSVTDVRTLRHSGGIPMALWNARAEETPVDL